MQQRPGQQGWHLAVACSNSCPAGLALRRSWPTSLCRCCWSRRASWPSWWWPPSRQTCAATTSSPVCGRPGWGKAGGTMQQLQWRPQQRFGDGPQHLGVGLWLRRRAGRPACLARLGCCRARRKAHQPARRAWPQCRAEPTTPLGSLCSVHRAVCDLPHRQPGAGGSVHAAGATGARQGRPGQQACVALRTEAGAET